MQHKDPAHLDQAHPHVHTTPPDPATQKTVWIAVAGAVVAIAAAIIVTTAVVRDVSVRNGGDVEVRVDYAWTAKDGRQRLERHVSPGNALSFNFEQGSEILVYHPAPDDKVVWTTIPVGSDDRKFEIVPKSAGTITASHDGQPIALTLTQAPISR